MNNSNIRAKWPLTAKAKKQTGKRSVVHKGIYSNRFTILLYLSDFYVALSCLRVFRISGAFSLCRVTLTSVMKCLDRFLLARVSCWLSMPIRYETRFIAPSLLREILWMYMLQVMQSIFLLSCEGHSSADGGQLLPGFWSSAGNHSCHQQGTLRPSFFFSV